MSVGQGLHGAMLPFPLNHIVPYMQRRKMLARFSGQSAEQASHIVDSQGL